MPEEVRTLVVKAADPNKVGLFDRNPAHPPSAAYPQGGEVFVTGEESVEVADVSEVRQALKEGRLIEIGGSNPNQEVTPAAGEVPRAAPRTQRRGD